MSERQAGRVGWLELNAQRSAVAVGFYRDLFGWGIRPVHIAPWGVLPFFEQGGRPIGLAFSAMGAFAPPRWLPEFLDHPDDAHARVTGLGGEQGGLTDSPRHGRFASLRDPDGCLFKILAPTGADAAGELSEVWFPDRLQPGGIWGAGLWAYRADRLITFYAALLGLQPRVLTTDRHAPGGAVTALCAGGEIRLLIHDTDYEIARARWVPMVCSVSPGGDGRRAEVLGAVPQVPVFTLEGLGRIGVWSDPSGADIAMINPQSSDLPT
ncbi:MAG: VOC family protein [Pseudomonadota bacterium]